MRRWDRNEERQLKSGRLGKDTTYRLLVTGPVAVKELDALIAAIAMDRDIIVSVLEESAR